MSLRRMLGSAVLTGWLLVSCGVANAGTWVAGELPDEFTNEGSSAFVSADPKLFKNQQVISKEAAKLTQRVSKCYEAAARNYGKGQPTLLVGCLSSARQKYLAKLAKVEAKGPGLPPCHDYAAEPDLAEAYLLDSMPDLLCASPDGAYVDGVVLF